LQYEELMPEGQDLCMEHGSTPKWKPGWIDPDDPPYDGWLVDPADYFAFGPKENQERQRNQLNGQLGSDVFF
jgi:hypothetical protein